VDFGAGYCEMDLVLPHPVLWSVTMTLRPIGSKLAIVYPPCEYATAEQDWRLGIYQVIAHVEVRTTSEYVEPPHLITAEEIQLLEMEHYQDKQDIDEVLP
jgi:hypothetical protein